MNKKIFKLIEKVSPEAMSAIGQMMLGPGELGKKNGGQDMGVYRLQSAANMFRWCAVRIEEFVSEYLKRGGGENPTD